MKKLETKLMHLKIIKLKILSWIYLFHNIIANIQDNIQAVKTNTFNMSFDSIMSQIFIIIFSNFLLFFLNFVMLLL